MIKNPKVYVGFLLILIWVVIDAILLQDYILLGLGLCGIGLIGYQLRVQEDVRLVIIRNKIKRKYEGKSLQDYYVIFIELTNLSTYSQYYDIHLTDTMIQESHNILKKSYHNVFLYSADQMIIILEFQHKTVINQRLRNEEQLQTANHIKSILTHHKFQLGTSQQYHHLTCSIGTGSMGIRGDYNTITDMIRLAQFAMLRAKEAGQDILIATEEIRLIKEDVDIFNQELEAGLQYDEIVPHFLPIVDPHSMRVIGCESLLRWEKNEYRIIEASKFKQVAEEKNLFDQLDLMIIKKSLSSYASWLADDLIDPDFTMTLNVNMNTLEHLHAHELMKLVQAYDIPSSNIEFDISEHDLSHNHTIDVIQKLRAFGFRVSVDAFRANTSVLETLSRVPIDTIKLDRLILPEGTTDESRLQFYRMIVKLSRLLGYNTMAKGVENRNQLALAKELQVDYIQGYYITPPLNDMKIRGFLNKYHRSILA